MKEPTQFLTNEKGEKIAVVIGIEEYEKLLEELEALEDIRAFDEAEASGEPPGPFDKAIAEIKRSRKGATAFSSCREPRENWLICPPSNLPSLNSRYGHCRKTPDLPVAKNWPSVKAGASVSAITASSTKSTTRRKSLLSLASAIAAKFTASVTLRSFL